MKGENFINSKIQNKILDLKKTVNMIDKFLEDAPKGCLKYQIKAGKAYYYQKYKNEEENSYVVHYIERKDEKLAMKLAQKGYFIMIKPLLEKEIKALEQFLESYNTRDVDEVYDGLADARKKLITPVRMSKKELINKWESEKFELYKGYEENLKYETEGGEIVRSKSEVIIANLLYSKRNVLRYKYERPLDVRKNGRLFTIHPDFTIMNINTGKVVYWEHAGCMDNVEYVNDFICKVNTYISNNIIPGKNLIITYETLDSPLNVNTIKILINRIIDDD